MDEDRKKELDELKVYFACDWDLAEETPEYFLLKRNKQSVGIHFLLALFFWWTFGLVNLFYWLLKKETKKVIK